MSATEFTSARPSGQYSSSLSMTVAAIVWAAVVFVGAALAAMHYLARYLGYRGFTAPESVVLGIIGIFGLSCLCVATMTTAPDSVWERIAKISPRLTHLLLGLGDIGVGVFLILGANAATVGLGVRSAGLEPFPFNFVTGFGCVLVAYGLWIVPWALIGVSRELRQVLDLWAVFLGFGGIAAATALPFHDLSNDPSVPLLVIYLGALGFAAHRQTARYRNRRAVSEPAGKGSSLRTFLDTANMIGASIWDLLWAAAFGSLAYWCLTRPFLYPYAGLICVAVVAWNVKSAVMRLAEFALRRSRVNRAHARVALEKQHGPGRTATGDELRAAAKGAKKESVSLDELEF